MAKKPDKPQPGKKREQSPDESDRPTRLGEPAPEGKPAGAPARPAEGESPPPIEKHFQIEWHEEDSAPESGHLFAEPQPEPPPQPFEIIREPRPAPDREPASATATRPAAGAQRQARAPAAPPPAHPPLWKRLVWGLMPMLLLLGGYASVVLTQGRVGYTWDEAYYYDPAMKAADWLTEVLRGKQPYDEKTIDAYWGERWEHPSVQKFLSGLAIRMFKNPKAHLYAMRLPMAILFGLSLTLIYMLGRRSWGAWPGLMSALIFATLPRVFGHAHFASMEMPLIFMTLLVVYCWLRGLDSAFWSACTGAAFGVLLATKINGFFLPIPLVLWSHLYARQRYVNNLFSMLTLGPLTMLAAWPWLWPDPAGRLLAYLAYHAQHQQTALYYLGQVWGYGRPNAPWHYPLVMICVTTPLASLALIAVGAFKTALKAPRRPHGALFLLIAAWLLAVASAPSTPRYDGIRLFLPVFPFLALLGGSAFVSMVSRLEQLDARRAGLANPPRWKLAPLARRLTLALIVLNGGTACVRSYPFLLSFFNVLVGGMRGANALGFEVTYWNDAFNREVIERLNQLPAGSRIMPLAMHELCLKQCQEWGLLNPELRIGGNPPYDYHLLQMRRGFFGAPEKALADGGRFKPIAEWGVPGAPLMALYQTGPAFEEYWPRMKQVGVF